MLLLFDIDGTLLQGATRAHSTALRRALHQVLGIGRPDGERGTSPQVAAAGRTDMEIAREIAMLEGVPTERFEDRREEIMSICVSEFARLVPDDLSEHVVTGMPELLAELQELPGVMLSLVTGNLEGVARLKLKRAGIGRFFAHGQGGFGSDSDDRPDLPPIARGRAGRPGSGPYPRERTIVIGDTVLDIACAHADELACVAVTTGPTGAEQLGEADAVARDMTELRNELLGRIGAR